MHSESTLEFISRSSHVKPSLSISRTNTSGVKVKYNKRFVYVCVVFLFLFVRMLSYQDLTIIPKIIFFKSTMIMTNARSMCSGKPNVHLHINI